MIELELIIKGIKTMATYITKTCGLIGDQSIDRQNLLAQQALTQGILPISLYYYATDNEPADQLSSRLDGILSGFSFGDDLILQLPTALGTQYEQTLLDKINSYRQTSTSKLIIVIHEVTSDAKQLQELINYYNQADALILPSVHYGTYLQEHGLTVSRLSYLSLDQQSCHYQWTYPPFNNQVHPSTPHPEIDKVIEQHQLSVGDSLQEQLSQLETDYQLNQQGGWGLIWPANDQDAFELKMIPTSQFNHFIQAGLPVIIKEGNALQRFVENYQLGFVVDDISAGLEKIKSCSQQDYLKICKRVYHFRKIINSGLYINQALNNMIGQIKLAKIVSEDQNETNN